jgi:predicted esterase
MGELNQHAKTVWYVIHGFGQLAGEFIKQFEYLVNENAVVIAPEGLSRSYFGSKTGASWMTKEDRENEIKDYVEYLDNLHAEILSKTVGELNVNILGFSQGVHTAARWFSLGKFQFQNLFLCSSDFPRDADFTKLREKLVKAKCYYMCGDDDEFITADAFEGGKNLLSENNIPFEAFYFAGKHVLNHDIIKRIISRNN